MCLLQYHQTWPRDNIYRRIIYDDVIKWKHIPRYWPLVPGIHRSPVKFPHKGQWRGALMFSLICAYSNGWVNTREAGDLRRYRAHYDVILMWSLLVQVVGCRRCVAWNYYLKELWLSSESHETDLCNEYFCSKSYECFKPPNLVENVNFKHIFKISDFLSRPLLVNTLRPQQNGRHFPDIFKCVLLNKNERISLKISLRFVLNVRINNIPVLVQIWLGADHATGHYMN